MTLTTKRRRRTMSKRKTKMRMTTRRRRREMTKRLVGCFCSVAYQTLQAI